MPVIHVERLNFVKIGIPMKEMKLVIKTF